MKSYWDSSALVIATQDAKLRDRLVRERGFARPHALAETFSALTGKLDIRMDADFAARLLTEMAGDLDFLDLSPQEILSALRSARQRGVRGGRVHDFLHAMAAKKSGANSLLTNDRNDFDSLVPGLAVEQI
jgi:predicted nucleic acid-binding protein